MKNASIRHAFSLCCFFLFHLTIAAQEEISTDMIFPSPEPLPDAQEAPVVPDSLKSWEKWATRGDKLVGAPPIFNNAGKRIALWPSELMIDAGGKAGSFEVKVQVYAPTWLSLPGNGDYWPHDVVINQEAAVVVERDGRPATKLEPGLWNVKGEIRWDQVPQKLSIPPEIGILKLTMNGNEVVNPNWDSSGFLWLRRNRAEEEAEKEFLETKIYRVLEDGIPMWLHTDIELSVAGKSREEDLGHALPEGWQVATVESRLPCAVDDSGRVRVQARAGKWTISIKAFRTDSITEVAFPESAPPMVETEILGFQAKPDFRVVELRNIQAIDVSQTTFPEKWRKLPVYRWETATPFQLEEKMRGMGFQKVSGLEINRDFWLDDDGALMTFRDRIKGTAQKDWRLNASPGQTLGAARMNGEGQLITRDPVTGANGIEIRQREIDLEAVGRISDARQFPASGWQADVDKCEATLNLPPGWRVLAMFGTEWVRGDWLTSWTLLDLFLLLVFTMSVWKLWGWIPAAIALIGFGLTFHEPGAPKYLWFFLLVPLAILRVGVKGKAKLMATIVKYFAVACLLVVLVPFIGRQLQGVIYPQLEPGGISERRAVPSRGSFSIAPNSEGYYRQKKMAVQKPSNLAQDLQARIQTGPAIPDWQWRQVRFGWQGPVIESEQVRVILIPPAVQRGIAVLRVLMLILLVAVLLQVKRILPPLLRGSKKKKAAAATIILGCLFFSGNEPAQAQEAFPPESLLKELREILLETPDAFPRAAEIPEVSLEVGENAIKMKATIHAAAQTAVPLPGKLPAWSPVSVSIDGQPAQSVARIDEYLWVVLEPGIHNVEVEGLLPQNSEWSWTFLLKPRRVEVDAPNWTVTGIRQNGVPENQVFFALKSPAVTSEAAYDRKDFAPAVAVERDLEIGLVWQVRTTLTRLTPQGKAVAFSIPLLPGERVLSSNFTVENNRIQVRLGANDSKVSWQSELPPVESMELTAPTDEPWVERWTLAASPVWNVRFDGLSPVYQSNSSGLNPVWRPWPGEQTTLEFSKPEAIPGATMTVRMVEHSTAIGSRQRVSKLKLDLQASLGQDFQLDLPPEADVTGLTLTDSRNPKGQQQPVRRDGASVIIPVRPGEQVIDLEWKMRRDISQREVVDRLELPVESSNIHTKISLPQSRWVLWTFGPLRGPAVCLWSVLLLSIVGAFVLGRLSSSPLRGGEWALLVVGLSQVHPSVVLLVICWFFLIAWRGSDNGTGLKPGWFNLMQIIIVLGALPVAVIILTALHRGLLGDPRMMVMGNNSTATNLQWFAQRTDAVLPEAGVLSVSIWYYRILMLAWALWLAVSALRWSKWGWEQFSRRTLWKKSPPKIIPTPEGKSE